MPPELKDPEPSTAQVKAHSQSLARTALLIQGLALLAGLATIILVVVVGLTTKDAFAFGGVALASAITLGSWSGILALRACRGPQSAPEAARWVLWMAGVEVFIALSLIFNSNLGLTRTCAIWTSVLSLLLWHRVSQLRPNAPRDAFVSADFHCALVCMAVILLSLTVLFRK